MICSAPRAHDINLHAELKARWGLHSSVLSARRPKAQCWVRAAATPQQAGGETGHTRRKHELNAVTETIVSLNGAYRLSEPEPGPQAAKHQPQQFDWYKAWYPVAVLADLDPKLPSHAKLLGMDLAVWFDRSESKWRAFLDRCPHRLAPLSEGRIDAAGHLYCNYHGWQFDGSGFCRGIPQLPVGQTINPKKSCATSYPTCEREGLLWVWPDASPAAHVESAAPQAWPGLAPELDVHGDEAFPTPHKWYFRDLPACYLAVKENAFNDCSHDTVLHHGSGPMSDREKAMPIAMKVVTMTPTGYVVRESTAGKLQDTIRFPCGARRDFSPAMAGLAYVVPTGVGTVRQFHTFISADKTLLEQQQPQLLLQQQSKDHEAGNFGQSRSSGQDSAPAAAGSSTTSSSSNSTVGSSAKVSSPSAKPPKLPLMLRLFLLYQKLRPAWMHHLQGHLLVDADLAIQSRIDINRCVSDHVYMPAAVDAGPAAFLRWLREYGAGGPPVAKLSQPFMGQQHTLPATRQQLLDRFNTHTAHCKACRTAYNNFRRAQQVAAVLGLLAAAAAVAAAALLVAVGLPAEAEAASRAVKVAAGLGAVGVLCGLAWSVVGRVLQSFVFVDYDQHHPSKA